MSSISYWNSNCYSYEDPEPRTVIRIKLHITVPVSCAFSWSATKGQRAHASSDEIQTNARQKHLGKPNRSNYCCCIINNISAIYPRRHSRSFDRLVSTPPAPSRSSTAICTPAPSMAMGRCPMKCSRPLFLRSECGLLTSGGNAYPVRNKPSYEQGNPNTQPPGSSQKPHSIQTRLMYHAACKVEIQPFTVVLTADVF